jgi:predicted transcriptional regulator of viral defense system
VIVETQTEISGIENQLPGTGESCILFLKCIIFASLQKYTRMNYLTFRSRFYEMVSFTNDQVYAWNPDFDRNNLTRWAQKGLLIRLKKGIYTFPEYRHQDNIGFYLANKMYMPSYISLHSALSYYGLIPEVVTQVTSVSALKTAKFTNPFGTFSYKTIGSYLMFGYVPKTAFNDLQIRFATPEKALLDLLYLYPFYNSEAEIEALRIDAEFMRNNLNISQLHEFLLEFQNKALHMRVDLLLKLFSL